MTTNNINVLIKPASGNCNCSCKYCFYADVSKNREQFSYGMMTQETLENIVKKALKYARTSCTFAFQGGEPTLVGIGFYKQLLEFEKKYNVNNARIFNSIQTNGLVIDDEWAEFFAKNNFLVGLSLDGGRDLHNYFRVGNDGKGTYDKVVRAADCFDRHNVEYNILAVVTGVAAGHGQKIIRDFCKKGFRYLQFIPCLEPFDSTETSNFTLTSEKFETFLKTTFDIYYDKFMKGNPISIRQFDNYINMILGMPPESCGMSGVCAGYFVIEGDGSVYPCDFYVLDRYCLGNVNEDEFGSMMSSERATVFLEESKHIDEKCRYCKWYGICRGGCKRYREPLVDGVPSLNRFCNSYYEFFEYAYERLVEMARMVAVRYK